MNFLIKKVVNYNKYRHGNVFKYFSGVAEKYLQLLNNETLKHDKAQELAIQKLEKLSIKMCMFEDERNEYQIKLNEYYDELKIQHQKQDEKYKEEDEDTGINSNNNKLSPPSPPRHPRGLYLHGSVGTGKSICMDLFYNTCPVVKKRRVHFHDFMSEIHERIHTWKTLKYEESKKNNLTKKKKNNNNDDKLGKIDLSPESDAIIQVALDISNEALLLCFDEFQVTDIADALIMTKLFNTMWKNGTIVVATSNRPPSDLYENGLNRHYFLPFIDSLSNYCRVFPYETNIDYRLLLDQDEDDSNVVNTFLNPITSKNEMEFNHLFDKLCQAEEETEEKELQHNLQFSSKFGRTIQIPSSYGRICKFDFDDLCRKDLGAGDYNALAQFYHTIFIYNIPQMSTELHDEARRFITCIDQFYEAKIRVVCLAETEAKDLFLSPVYDEVEEEEVEEKELKTEIDKGGVDPAEDRPTGKIRENQLASVVELSFAFQRAASRLHEMASKNYIDKFMNQKK